MKPNGKKGDPFFLFLFNRDKNPFLFLKNEYDLVGISIRN
jgi:hypothetical protein